MVLDKSIYNLFIIFLLSPLFSIANQADTTNLNIYPDSLRNLPKTTNEAKPFNSFSSLSEYYSGKDLDSAIYYAERALNLAIQKNENKNIAKAYETKSLLLLQSKYLDLAKKNIALAKSYYYFDKDSVAVALMDLNLGDIYYKKADLNQSLYHFLLAYDFFKSKEPSTKLVETISKIGKIYSDLDMIEKSSEFQSLSLKLSQRLNSTRMIMTSKNRIALLLVKQDKYTEATVFFEEAIQLGVADKNLHDELLIAYIGLANVHFKNSKYELSIFCAHKSLAMLDIQKFPIKTAHLYHTLGVSYLGLKNFSKSEMYLLKAYEALTKFSSNAPALIECNNGLYQLYEKMGNHEKALYHYKLFINSKDSIYGKGINEKIIQLESNRLLAAQKKAYQELQLIAENEKMRSDSRIKNIIMVCAILVAVLFCLFLYFFFKNKAMKSEAELLFAQNKFDSLRSQMNPHFIFNLINGVQNYILKAEKYKAYNHLTTFASSIRLIIHNASKSFIPIKDELELIKTYIDLEKVRFRDDFDYQLNVDEKLNEINPLIPSMIVQPIIENAIIHGLSNKQDNGQLFINFEFGEGECFVKCSIKDNGIGREEAMKIKENKTLEEHLSISTTNSQQRINILKKMGYKKAEIRINDLRNEKGNPTGTEVTLNLPIKR